MPVLDQLADWPVNDISAAIVGPDKKVTFWGDEQRVYELASVTKLLTGYAALLAVEEEAIGLDDPAGPEGSTVRHLLSHASGLAQDSDEVVSEPGTQRLYSSRAFEVLADYIAQQSQIGFADYFHDGVVEALQLENTVLYGSAGFGGRSSVSDLAVFIQEILEPKILVSELVTEAITPQFPELSGFVPGYGKYKPNPWGLAFEIKGEKKLHWTGDSQSAKTVGHFGKSGTFLWADPEAHVGAVVLTTRPYGPWAKQLWGSFNDELFHYLTD